MGARVGFGAAPAAATTRTTAGGESKTVWLCAPGQADDPCTSNLSSTTVTANGSTSVTPSSAPATSSKFDCFYVYPTVSRQLTDNANLTVQRTEIAAAVSQASRFSQVCRVWAPMYRQRTAASLAKGLGGDPKADQVAYQSLLSGWQDYLAHDNDGRPIIFIGHSQGAAMVIRLLRSQIDPNPRLRTQLVSAIILGGNVQVPKGKTVGGSFRHIPTCASSRSDGLRHRLFDLRDQTAFDVQFRSARAGGEPPIRPDRVCGSTGGVRQSGDVLVRPGAAPPVLPRRHVTCHRRDGAHSLGLFFRGCTRPAA